MSFASLIKSFPQMLSQPTGIAVMASVGIHGLLGLTLPYLPLASQEKPGSPRTVQLVELTPAELSRLPQAAPPLTSLPVPNSSQSYQSLPTLPSSLSSPGSSSLSRGSLSRGTLAPGSLSRGSLAQGSLSRGSLSRGSLAQGSGSRGSLQRGSTGDLFGGKTRISDPPVRLELANRPRRNPRAADLFSVVRGVKPGDLREFSNRDIEQLDRANQRTEQSETTNQRTEQLDTANQSTDIINQRIEQLARRNQSTEQLDSNNQRTEQPETANQRTEQSETANQRTEQSETANQRTEQSETANRRTEQSETANRRTEQSETANRRTEQSETANRRTEQSETANRRTEQSETANRRTEQSETANRRTEQSETANRRTEQREETGQQQQLAYNPNGTSESDAIEKIKDTANQYENAQWQRVTQSISYPSGMACPQQAPNSASITVVVDSGNRIVSGPDLVQSTGYDVLNQKALEAVRGAIPSTNQRTVYNFRVNVNKESCTPNSGGTSEG